MAQKQDLSIQNVKKKFSNLAGDLQYQYKSNILAYRSRYLDLTTALNQLFKDVKKCQQSIIVDNINNFGKTDTENDKQQFADPFQQEYEPLFVVQFIRQFSQNAAQFCVKFRSREEQIKQQMSKLFQINATSHFLQALATKNLQNFDLSLKVEQLKKALDFKNLQLKIAEKTTKQYQKKFQVCQNDFNTVVVSISEMLKGCEKTETELRQQNRLQKQIFQSHKIQFERFKADFKYKPSSQKKADRVRQVLQKKFQDRQTFLLKQAQKIMESRHKGVVPQKKYPPAICSNKIK